MGPRELSEPDRGRDRGDRGRDPGVKNEGETYFSTQYEATEKSARFSRADEHEEWPARIEAPSRQGPQAADRQQRLRVRVSAGRALRPEERIRRRADFQQVYQNGIRVHGRYGTLFVLANRLAVGRIGIAATKKLGGAVQRNRAKRLIREVFRRNKVAPGFDVVVVPKRELLDASLIALETDYRTTLERTLRRSDSRSGAAQRL